MATEVVIVDRLSAAGEFGEGPEARRLNDGSVFVTGALLDEVRTVGPTEPRMDGPTFAIVRAAGRTHV